MTWAGTDIYGVYAAVTDSTTQTAAPDMLDLGLWYLTHRAGCGDLGAAAVLSHLATLESRCRELERELCELRAGIMALDY